MPRPTFIAALAAATLAMSALVAQPAAAATLGGQRCTIVGTSHADHLIGTKHRDVICGLGGNDVISGGGGNDVLLGGGGNDRISGGTGNDRIDGGTGKDAISGGTGNDTISGGTGNDSLSGGAGNDRMTGDAGGDAISGGSGKDVLIGAAGNDTVSGGADSDTVSGGDGNDRLTGGDGGDRLSGGAGTDTEDGGTGADVVRGDAGNDVIVGGSGNDTISGGAGNDTLTPGQGVDGAFGDAGNDAFRIGDDDLNDTIDGGTGVTSCYYEKTGMETPACRPPLTKTYITAATFSTQTIDTSAAAQTVHVEVFLENDVADVKAIEVGMSASKRLPSGMSLSLGGAQSVRFTFTSGTARHGWWGGDLTFPQYSAPTTYRISAHTTDVNNKQESWSDVGPGYGSPFHGPSTVEQTGAGDAEGPAVVTVSTSTRSIDTSGGPATVHVRAHVTDDFLGTKSVEIGASNIRNRQYQTAKASVALTSGTVLDGVWEGDIVLPRYSQQGTWSMFVTTSDGLHSGFMPDTSSLSFEQVGPGDASPPAVTSLTMPLDPIDTSVSGTVSLPVTVHLTDDLAGVAGSPTLRVMLPTTSVTQCTLQLQSGDSSSGDWGCTLQIGAGSRGGSYFFWLDMGDGAGHMTEVTLHDLAGQSGTVRLVNAAP